MNRARVEISKLVLAIIAFLILFIVLLKYYVPESLLEKSSIANLTSGSNNFEMSLQKLQHCSECPIAGFLDCVVEFCQNLPRGQDGRYYAHHYAAKNLKWNENIRFEPFQPTIPSDALILEIGGNTDAADSRVFRKMFPKARIHIYEPVPLFFEQLQIKWAADKLAFLHMVGLGAYDRNITLSENEIDGQSTFVMESADGYSANSRHNLKIVDASTEIKFFIDHQPNIHLLHINCEGCEWDFLMRLAETDLLKKIVHIQVSFHNYGKDKLEEYGQKYCLIRQALIKTHVKISAIPFGWERWSLKTQ